MGKEDDARRLVSALQIAIDPVDEAVAITAARLRAQHGGILRMPDAPRARLCRGNAKSVLTAGLRWKAWSRRVEVVGA
jgi:hypothetical protein